MIFIFLATIFGTFTGVMSLYYGEHHTMSGAASKCIVTYTALVSSVTCYTINILIHDHMYTPNQYIMMSGIPLICIRQNKKFSILHLFGVYCTFAAHALEFYLQGYMMELYLLLICGSSCHILQVHNTILTNSNTRRTKSCTILLELIIFAIMGGTDIFIQYH
jgi:hypothetical protein